MSSLHSTTQVRNNNRALTQRAHHLLSRADTDKRVQALAQLHSLLDSATSVSTTPVLPNSCASTHSALATDPRRRRAVATAQSCPQTPKRSLVNSSTSLSTSLHPPPHPRVSLLLHLRRPHSRPHVFHKRVLSHHRQPRPPSLPLALLHSQARLHRPVASRQTRRQ